MSETIYHHKIHVGGPLPNICSECTLELAYADLARWRGLCEQLANGAKAALNNPNQQCSPSCEMDVIPLEKALAAYDVACEKEQVK